MNGGWKKRIHCKEWKKSRSNKRNRNLNRLSYSEWKKSNYEKTSDYSFDHFFSIVNS